MTEPTEACVLCGADRTTVALAQSSKSGFKHYVCASPGGCRRRRELKAAHDAGVAEGRRQAAADIERPDSMLCDCPREESTPTNPNTGAEMDHHCDCAAVRAAATMLRSYSATLHGQQCIHGTTMDEFYAEGADGG